MEAFVVLGMQLSVVLVIFVLLSVYVGVLTATLLWSLGGFVRSKYLYGKKSALSVYHQHKQTPLPTRHLPRPKLIRM